MRYDELKLDHQLCFPLYSCSKAIVHKSNAFLKDINLSYTQYIVMMVLWEKHEISLKDLGKLLYLDSGTLTPVLKNLESKGYVSRSRDKNDERVLMLTLSDAGKRLKTKALQVPSSMRQCVCLEQEEIDTLYKLLYKLLGNLESEE